MDMPAEDGVRRPQAQEHRLPPTVGRDQEGSPLRASRRGAACQHPDFVPGQLT